MLLRHLDQGSDCEHWQCGLKSFVCHRIQIVEKMFACSQVCHPLLIKYPGSSPISSVLDITQSCQMHLKIIRQLLCKEKNLELYLLSVCGCFWWLCCLGRTGNFWGSRNIYDIYFTL